MPSIYDVYEYYLEPEDLKGQAHVRTVESAKLQSMHNQRTHQNENKIVVRFVKTRKAMILNKTQAGALAEIAGTDDYTKWKGAEVVLVEGRAPNGKPTITVTTREKSGDADLKDLPTPPRNEGLAAGWWHALSGPALDYAETTWQVDRVTAYRKILKALEESLLREPLPAVEFREWVNGMREGAG